MEAQTPEGRSRKTAILLFDEVEVLDFCGPFEVFSVTGLTDQRKPFEVFTVAQEPGPVSARNQLSINPRYSINEAPPADILLIPGGYGTRREMHNPVIIDWIREYARSAELILSVCTGALLLARAGLLDGLEATTHFGALDLLQQTAPKAVVHRDRRFIDNGRVVVSAGISAGIDMSLYVVARLLGPEQARKTARYMEYDWRPGDK